MSLLLYFAATTQPPPTSGDSNLQLPFAGIVSLVYPWGERTAADYGGTVQIDLPSGEVLP